MNDLRPSLTRLNATALVAGTIIGASIFVQPSEIAQHLSQPAEIMLVWLACGILTLFGALVCAELASAIPDTGGLYIFLRETFSPFAGFLWGWAMFWVMHTGIPYLAERLDRGYRAFADCRAHTSRPPSETLKQFYLDTVSFNPPAMHLALEFAGEDHLLAGSDYPHQIGSIPLMLESIGRFDVAGGVKEKILGANAARLLGL